MIKIYKKPPQQIPRNF